MTYNYRAGAIVTFVRDDGRPGPGEVLEFNATDGWKVEIQDQGCAEITGYLRKPVPPSVIVPWHRIWQITTIPDPGSGPSPLGPPAQATRQR
jgi:hypothetical protein